MGAFSLCQDTRNGAAFIFAGAAAHSALKRRRRASGRCWLHVRDRDVGGRRAGHAVEALGWRCCARFG